MPTFYTLTGPWLWPMSAFSLAIILQVASELSVLGYEVIDAMRLKLLPVLIDPHVHFREPGLERKEDLFTKGEKNLGVLPIWRFIR